MGKVFCLLFGAITVALLGPCFAVPRMSAAAWDAVSRIIPEQADWTWLVILFNAVFYLITWFFLHHETKILDRLVKYLVPGLLLMEVVLVSLAVFSPPGEIGPAVYDEPPFVYGFINGYQTLDLICALVFSGIILSNLRHKIGHSSPHLTRYLILAGFKGFLTLAVIQCGEMYRGSTASLLLPDLQYAKLSSSLAFIQMGFWGLLLFNMLLLLACMTTAIGLIGGAVNFTVLASDNKIPFSRACPCALFVAFCISCLGLDIIVDWLSPILSFLYPPFISLTLCLVFLEKYKAGTHGACYATLLWGVLDCIKLYLEKFGIDAIDLFTALPGHGYGLGFLWFMSGGWLLGEIWARLRPQPHSAGANIKIKSS